jgi:uncharacterized protein YndB with AHSA1/START domain
MNSADAAPAEAPMVVRKTLTVAAGRERAFKVFTAGMSSWWPLQTHHIGAVDARETVIEPRAGGRWYEIGVDGSECDWGRVLAWEPPGRLLLSWEINADFKHDLKVVSEVEVRFIAEGERQTRLELEHRALECYGARAQQMHGLFDSPGGWSGTLVAFRQAAERAS